MDGKEIHEQYRTIPEEMVIGRLETRTRTYRVIQSGRYPWDGFRFNMNVVTKWLSYGKLTYSDGVQPLESKIENAVRCYAMVMDAYKCGDIIHLYHQEPFTYKDYVILSNDIVLDGYGVGLYLKEMDDVTPNRGCREESCLDDAYVDVPQPERLSWFDFMSYYHPEKKSVNKFRKETLKSFVHKIRHYEEEIEWNRKQIETLENNRCQFNVRFIRYIKQIRQNAKKR